MPQIKKNLSDFFINSIITIVKLYFISVRMYSLIIEFSILPDFTASSSW